MYQKAEEHYIDLSRPWYTYGDFFSENTLSLLKTLNSLTNHCPLQIFINSCYSGLVNKYITALSPGSTLITSASSENKVYVSQFSDLNFTAALSAEEKFLQMIKRMPQECAFNKKLSNGSIFQYVYNPSSVNLNQKQAAHHIREAENQFITMCIERGEATSETFAHEFPFLPKEEDGLLSLIRNGEVIMRNGGGRTLPSILESNPNAKDYNGSPILYWAAWQTNSEAFDRLIKAGADPNIKAANGTPILYWAAKEEKEQTFERLIKAGADPNVKAADGTPILSWAAYEASSRAFDKLVKAGADPNATFQNGRSLLFEAAKENNIIAFERLLQVGGDPSKNNGNTTLQYLIRANPKLQAIFDKFKEESLKKVRYLEKQKRAFDASFLGRLSGHEKVTDAEIGKARERYMQFLTNDERKSYLDKLRSSQIKTIILTKQLGRGR